MNEFLQRLKQRKLVQWAVAYVAAGFAVLQGIDIVAQRFGWPEQTMRFVIVTMSVGFFVTLVLAWYHGERGAQRVSGTELLILAGLLVLGGGFLWQFAGASRKPAPIESSMPNEPQSVANAKSIAVLPFENLSEDKANAYFAEGVQDEILTRLAKVADLKVISRTSTQHFKSSPDNLPQIAQQLGVAHILEGSVQKANEQVRVNVQLIKAATDAHLWAETFDRKLTDIFAVESEIAKNIADALQARLTGSEQHAIAAQPTQNTEAYQLYLKGRYFWNKRTAADLHKAVDYFNQAIAKDPKYALAYAGLADAYQLFSGYGAGTPQESYPKAKVAAKRALELDDSLGEAHASLAKILCFYDLDFAGSTKEFERAIALNPNYATAHQWFGNSTLAVTGQFERAVAEGKRAVELDPLSLVINTDLGFDYFYQRRYDEAIEQLRRTIEIDPRYYSAHYTLGEVLELKGQLPEALAKYKKAAELDDNPYVLGLVAQACAKLGRRDEALKLLQQMEQLSAGRYVADYSLALVHLALSEKEKAIELLENAYRNRVGGDVPFIKVDPMLDPLRGDPRFEALAEKIVPAREFAKAAPTSK